MNPSTVASVITWVCLAGVIACNIAVIHYGRRTKAAARRAQAAADHAKLMADLAEAASRESSRHASFAYVSALKAAAAHDSTKAALTSASGLTPSQLAATIREQRGSGHRG